MLHDIDRIAKKFQIPGRYLSAIPFGTGLINDTYQITFEQNSIQSRYLLQHINHEVFKNPPAVMNNIRRITDHIRAKLQVADEDDIERKVMRFMPAADDSLFYRDEHGNYWRTCRFVENTRTYDEVGNPGQAFEAAKAFGRFQSMLADLPGPRLHESIPDFHNTPKRFRAFTDTLGKDPVNRAKECKAEIESVLERQNTATVLTDSQAKGDIPERPTHNDTKVNNVLFDNETDVAICVIDLDTVMPGLVHYDFGDMVRAGICLAPEDEPDLAKVKMEMPLFQALARGYVSIAKAFLNQVEKRHLAFSGKLITYEQAIRFLTDYLAGDTYYKVNYPRHNLVRARAQFKLLQSMEEQEQDMEKIVKVALTEE